VARLEQAVQSVVQWEELLAVRTREAGPDGPAILGRYEIARGEVVFTPRFPFVPGLTYDVSFDGAVFDRLSGVAESSTSSRSESFTVPRAQRLPSTVVLGIYPTGSDVPENLLRLYVEFSAPIAVQDVSAHVRLLDSTGHEVESAFVEIREGLWDPGRTRLTLFLHPGRIKRGVGPNRSMGPPLRSGETYELEISSELIDAGGLPLRKPHRKMLRAGPPDRSSPDPARWRMIAPAASRAPLVLAFPQPLDSALLRRLLQVIDSTGEPVTGRVELTEGETLWTFSPNRPWTAGEHRVRVHPALEDLAGNRIDGLFDEKMLDSKGPGGVRQGVAELTFTVGK
jgi:hypothetical protein